MLSVRRSSSTFMFLFALGCSPSVTESASDDDVADESTTGDSDASSEASDDATSTSTSTTTTTTDGTSTETTGDTSTETTGDTSGDDPMMCTPGTLDCECDAGMCEADLLCVQGVCVEIAETDTTDTTDTGVEPHNCGWVLREDYYFCEGEGEDPDMVNPADCDAFNFPMVDGAPCGGELNYIGCCDAMGDAWYCLEGFVKYKVCGA